MIQYNSGYTMTGMKTAISLPDALYRAANRLARIFDRAPVPDCNEQLHDKFFKKCGRNLSYGFQEVDGQ